MYSLPLLGLVLIHSNAQLDGYIKYPGQQCTGSDTDILRDFAGTAEECAAKCDELDCIGFIRVNSGSQFAGNCFFRGGTLQDPVPFTGDNRDCYEPAPECPDGTQRIGDINADIAGCGLEGCNARYQDNYPDIEACRDGCDNNAQCVSFTWAPIDGDQDHPGQSVCTLYGSRVPTGLAGPIQILCVFDGSMGYIQTECLSDGNEIVGWYDGTTIDIANGIWYDRSGNENHGIIDNTTGIGVSATQTPTDELYANGHPVVSGTTSTRITFPAPLNPENYTVFNLCKYRVSGAKERILQTSMENTIWGFWESKSGLGFSEGWITQREASEFGNEWVISSQQYNLYRGNLMDLTLTPNDGRPLSDDDNQLMINQGRWPDEQSDFACADIIYSNDKLSLDEIQCIENYLNQKYLQTPECPDGTEQIGVFNADIIGCGLEPCNARYRDNYTNIEECRDGCDNNAQCASFSWAPIDGDEDYPGQSVCTLYNSTISTGLAGTNQILCALLAEDDSMEASENDESYSKSDSSDDSSSSEDELRINYKREETNNLGVAKDGDYYDDSDKDQQTVITLNISLQQISCFMVFCCMISMFCWFFVFKFK